MTPCTSPAPNRCLSYCFARRSMSVVSVASIYFNFGINADAPGHAVARMCASAPPTLVYIVPRTGLVQKCKSRCCPHTKHVTSYMAKRFFTSRFGRGEAHRETDAAALSRMLDSTAAVDESAPGPEVAAALGGACARALCVRAVSRVVCVLNGGVGAACSRSRVGDSARHVHRVW